MRTTIIVDTSFATSFSRKEVKTRNHEFRRGETLPASYCPGWDGQKEVSENDAFSEVLRLDNQTGD